MWFLAFYGGYDNFYHNYRDTILDVYKRQTVYDSKENSKEKTIIPYPLRCWIVGSSEIGKTTLLLNFICKSWIPYKIYMFLVSH